MRFYEAMVAVGWPKSFVGKIMLVSFLGVHVPLIGLIVYLLMASSLSLNEALSVAGVVLVATLLGTGSTMAALWALNAPVRAASRALNAYLTERRIPELPIHRHDEAGHLMADVQKAVTRLDGALDAALSARDRVLEERRATFGALAQMGHELRTPLNAVLGFSEILQHELRQTQMEGDVPGANVAEYAGDIHASGTRLLALVQALLDLSQAQSGALNLEMDKLDLHQAVGAAVGLTSLGAKSRGITVRSELPAVPATRAIVQADARAVKQVLLHALSGMIESAPQGGLIRVLLDQERTHWTLSLSATGGGFHSDDLPETLRTSIKGDVTVGPIASTSALGLRLMVVKALGEPQGIALVLHAQPTERQVQLVFPDVRKAA